MKKELIILISLIIFLVVLLTITLSHVEQIISSKINAENKEYDMMWTKAICNETSCQDYEIKCKDKEVISKTPITGAIMVIDNNWKDPRPSEFQERLC